jgi:hypothetical protein
MCRTMSNDIDQKKKVIDKETKKFTRKLFELGADASLILVSLLEYDGSSEQIIKGHGNVFAQFGMASFYVSQFTKQDVDDSDDDDKEWL